MTACDSLVWMNWTGLTSARQNTCILSCIYVNQSNFVFFQALITQTRAKQAATMSEVDWRGRSVPVKNDKARIFLLGLSDNEDAIAQVKQQRVCSYFLFSHDSLQCR